MRIINGQESNNIINRNNMDENSLSHQNGSIIGGGNSQNAVNTNNITNKAGGDETNGGNTNNMAQYTIPGVLHYIQHEWARFELERSQWDVDRAELQAKIGVLIGERKGQESLKSDLIRRIKMLEYALKQERAKYYRLKYGADPPLNEVKSPTEEGVVNEVAPDPEGPFSPASNITWRQGRQLLRQYLQEIGYTDTIIDVRSNRVRSLLGLNSNQEQEENVNPNINGTESGNKRASESQAKKTQQTAMTEAMLLESEAAVLANFEFLAQADVEMSDDDDMENDLDIVTNDDESDVKTTKRRTKQITLNDDDVDAEADEVLNELNLITEGENANLERSQDNNEWSTGFKNNKDIRRQTMPRMSGGGADEEVDQSLGLGELAQLTITNEAEQTYDMANSKEPFRKTWNAKYTLRSHFDCVRALAFHPQDQVLITASEDHTLKLWNLQKTVPAKKQASLDVEPLYTFRGHTGPVLCLAMSATGEQCYSGSLDSTINVWQLPNSNIDPYDNYDADVLRTTLEGHKDAVWGLAVNHAKESVLSCSADGTVKLWSPNAPAETSQLLGTYTPDTPTPEDIPTSIDFVRDELDKLVAAYQNSNCVIYDTETRKVLLTFDAQQEVRGNFGKYINKVISHPTLPIVITAHEDRHIRFWDTNTGSLIHAMVAHLDAVTSLAIDAHGLYLLSGSQDCSIRLWHMENKTCVQEITAHRKKFDESILDVAFHPSKPLIASAGADAIAKVFV